MASKILAGRYELLVKKGDGGMAVVYKAKDRLLNRFVAIKILKPEYIRDPKFVDSFRRESQAAAGFSHPNVVSVYDVGKEGNIYYIVMEMMDGDTLSDVIRREAPLGEKRVIEISKQIAAALGAAHKKNIIHRDVKPHNILFSDDGTAKITDFGIAKAVNNGTIVNSATTVLGSVHYLSPEQARGGFVDAKSDIYSLGIVMYEMLTGKVPFDGENAVSVAMMHINGNVPAPSLENPAVSAIMDAIVLKATNRQPGDRFNSADELIEALNNAADGVAMASAGATSVYGLKELYGAGFRKKTYDSEREQEISSFDDLDDLSPEYAEGEKYPEEYSENSQKKNRLQKNRKSKEAKAGKKTKIAAVVLALICALPLSMGILSLMGGSGSKTIDVPYVIGMTEEQAALELKKCGLEYKLGIPVISEEYEEGLVVSTDPDAEKKVKEGYTVTLILSRGDDSSSTSVPIFVGKKLDDAKSILESYELVQGTVTYEKNDLPEGFIIRQDPEPGTEVKTGTAISFVVSEGPDSEEIKVPDLRGMTERQAEDELKKFGLKLGNVSEAHSNSEAGTVIGQTKDPDSSAEEGESIGITVSKGPEEAPEPVSIPLTVNYSAANTEVFTLTVTVTDSNGLHYVVNNQSRIKSDGSETVTLTGVGTGTVRVIIDNQIIDEFTANFETGELN